MLELIDYLILFLVGCAGGYLAGLLGIGGGIIFVVILSIYMNNFGVEGPESVRYIVSNSLFATFFAGVTGTYRHIKNNFFYPQAIVVTAIPGIISSLIVSFFIVRFDWYSEKVFGISFLLMLMLLTWRLFSTPKKGVEIGYKVTLPKREFATLGVFSGILSALSGLGGGILVIPVLHGLRNLNIKIAASVSMGIICFFAFFNSILYALASQNTPLDIPYSMGYIILPLVLPMVAGVLIFTQYGIKTSQKLSQRSIRVIYAIFLTIVCIKMFYTNFVT